MGSVSRKSAFEHEQMGKGSSGQVLSIDTFYSSQWFCNPIVKALIRLHSCLGQSGPLLSAYARRPIFPWHGHMTCPEKTRFSQGIHAVWSKSLLVALWQAKYMYLVLLQTKTDKTVLMHRLIWVAWCSCQKVHFFMFPLVCAIVSKITHLGSFFCFGRIFKRYRSIAPDRIPLDMKSEKTKRLKIPSIEIEAMPELRVCSPCSIYPQYLNW